VDCHMKFGDGVLNSLADQAIERQGIVTPCCQNYPNGKHLFRATYLYYDAENVGVDNCWRYGDEIRESPLDTHEIPAVLGACYAIPRTIWEQLGGAWWNTFDLWGFSEQHLALRCWFQGIKQYLDPRLVVQHKFWGAKGAVQGAAMVAADETDDVPPEKLRPYSLSGNPKLKNAAGTMASIWSQPTWSSVFAPIFNRQLPADDFWPELQADHVVLERREWLEARKVLSDSEVLARLKERRHSKDEKAAAKRKARPSVKKVKGDHDFEDVLRKALRAVKPERVLEWGPGYSTGVILEECPNCHLDSIESDADWHQRYQAKFPDVRIRLFPLKSRTEYSVWPLNGAKRYGPYDLVFVDGRRRRECLVTAAQILNPGGVVVLHDADRWQYRDVVEMLFDVLEWGVRKRAVILKPKGADDGGPGRA
jgi:predicted O-methyltransferase YrrM